MMRIAQKIAQHLLLVLLSFDAMADSRSSGPSDRHATEKLTDPSILKVNECMEIEATMKGTHVQERTRVCMDEAGILHATSTIAASAARIAVNGWPPETPDGNLYFRATKAISKGESATGIKLLEKLVREYPASLGRTRAFFELTVLYCAKADWKSAHIAALAFASSPDLKNRFEPHTPAGMTESEMKEQLKAALISMSKLGPPRLAKEILEELATNLGPVSPLPGSTGGFWIEAFVADVFHESASYPEAIIWHKVTLDKIRSKEWEDPFGFVEQFEDRIVSSIRDELFRTGRSEDEQSLLGPSAAASGIEHNEPGAENVSGKYPSFEPFQVSSMWDEAFGPRKAWADAKAILSFVENWPSETHLDGIGSRPGTAESEREPPADLSHDLWMANEERHRYQLVPWLMVQLKPLWKKDSWSSRDKAAFEIAVHHLVLFDGAPKVSFSKADHHRNEESLLAVVQWFRLMTSQPKTYAAMILTNNATPMRGQDYAGEVSCDPTRRVPIDPETYVELCTTGEHWAIRSTRSGNVAWTWLMPGKPKQEIPEVENTLIPLGSYGWLVQLETTPAISLYIGPNAEPLFYFPDRQVATSD